MEVDKDLKDYARHALGHKISEDRIIEIVNILTEKGIEYVSDLKDRVLNRIQLITLIPEAQVNKLYNTWQDEQEEQVITPAPAATRFLQRERADIAFQVNFEEIGMKERLTSPTKLEDSIYTTFVHHIVTQIIRFYGPENPGIDIIRKISRDIATVYPHHFFEKIGDRVLSTCDTLVTRIRAHRYYKTGGKNTSKRKSADAYGCVDPAPRAPDGYTAEQLEEIRQDLVTLHERPHTEWDIPTVKKNMDLTYSSQRAFINQSKPQTLELIGNWPFLQYPTYFLSHFTKLTGVDALDVIHDFLETKAATYFMFFTMYCKNHKRCAEIYMELEFACGATRDITSSRIFGVLQMITEYMGDDFRDLLLIREETTGNMDLESDALIPATPTIIALGHDVWTSKEFCLVVENKLVARTTSAEEAVAIHFASFYVQNLRYPTDLNSTLDFWQRSIMNIAPETKGTKCSKKGNGSCPDLRLNVKKLQSEIEDFETLRSKIKDKFDVV